ncbi:MAG: putative cytokinetic ring protein SteA [Bacillota bacterium]
MSIRGRCRKDCKTKNLAKRILPGEIALINHPDLDILAAEALIKKRIKALINISPSLSGKYPALGTKKLLDAGIPVIDHVEPALMEYIKEGSVIEISGSQLIHAGKVFRGNRLEKSKLTQELSELEKALKSNLEDFTTNTLKFAAEEMKDIFASLPIPKLNCSIKGRHVLVVVRGRDYEEDLFAIRPYIKEVKPVLIGVDGGADALVEFGFKPDIIVGDMDSVSDQTLKSGSQLIIHSYLNGTAPGEVRIRNLNLAYNILPAVGTSEDLALLIAYQEGADLIVALGTLSSLMDFLDKGRDGMASTFLVRLKVGSVLVDAKGINKLYPCKVKKRGFAQLIIAAVLPLIIIFISNETFFQTIRLFWFRLVLMFGF